MANPSLQIGNENWAIKEDNLLGYSKAGTRFVPHPITMTRGSAGTRVNSAGLVETVELLGSNLTTPLDFTTWINSSATDITANSFTTGGGGAGVFFSLTTNKLYKINVSGVTGDISLRYRDGGGAGTVLGAFDTDLYFDTSGLTSPNIYIRSLSATTATVTSVSVKESTKNNLARVDYDGSVSSLLVEPERTNLVTYSEELQSTTNVTLSNTISPDGTLNGLKINETTSNSQHYATSYSAAVVSGTIYTVSFYIKKGTYDVVKVYTQSSKISASINITFSTESTSASGSDFISGSNFMEDAGNGWYRVGFSATASNGGSVSIYLPIKDLSTYVGDISQYTEYWGAQIEAGAYPTSYIPTDGGTVTRVKDQYEKTGISSLINSEEGVLFLEIENIVDSAADIIMIGLTDGSSTNRISIFISTGLLSVESAGSGLDNLGIYSKSLQSGFNKIAIKYEANNCVLWVNGTDYTDTSFTAFSSNTLNELAFNRGDGIMDFFGKVKQLKIYKTVLTPSELQTLTT